MNINESYVIGRLMEHNNWTHRDIEVLEAVANDLMSGPSYVLDESSEHIEQTLYVYNPKNNNVEKCYLGSWGAEGIIGDFYPIGIKHVQHMFEDVDEVFVNTECDSVFFGSEVRLWELEESYQRECCSFEEWLEEYADRSVNNYSSYDPDDEDSLHQGYDEWIYRQVEDSISQWRELDVRGILELFVGKRCAREIAHEL